MTKQYAYQLRHKAKGLCILCSRLAVNSQHCEIHRERVRIYMRKLLGFNAWKPGGRGKPPKK